VADDFIGQGPEVFEELVAKTLYENAICPDHAIIAENMVIVATTIDQRLFDAGFQNAFDLLFFQSQRKSSRTTSLAPRLTSLTGRRFGSHWGPAARKPAEASSSTRLKKAVNLKIFFPITRAPDT